MISAVLHSVHIFKLEFYLKRTFSYLSGLVGYPELQSTQARQDKSLIKKNDDIFFWDCLREMRVENANLLGQKRRRGGHIIAWGQVTLSKRRQKKNVWSMRCEECGKQLIIKERSAEWPRVQLGLECNLCWNRCWRTSPATFSSRLALTRVWPAPSRQGRNRRGGWKDAGKPINTAAPPLPCVAFLPATPDFLATSCLFSGSQTHAASSKSHLIFPLRKPCLRHPTDRGTWWAIAHGVAKSQTRLSD